MIYAMSFLLANVLSFMSMYVPLVSTKGSSCSGVVIDGRCYQFFRGPKQAPDAEVKWHLASYRVTTNYR